MKAMILAAGRGERLRPLTDDTPKALVEVGGVPMLEIVLRRLILAGVSEVVINVWHHADQITDFLRAKRHFGIRIELSRETDLLDTGGGLKKASPFFNDGNPFFLHNVDILTNMDISALYHSHIEHPALATLAVHARESERQLLFDQDGGLRGWESKGKPPLWAGAPDPFAERLAFCGVHVVSSEIFPLMTETDAFPLIPVYLRLAGLGRRVQAYRAAPCYWADVGDARKLAQAQRQARAAGLVP